MQTVALSVWGYLNCGAVSGLAVAGLWLGWLWARWAPAARQRPTSTTHLHAHLLCMCAGVSVIGDWAFRDLE